MNKKDFIILDEIRHGEHHAIPERIKVAKGFLA